MKKLLSIIISISIILSCNVISFANETSAKVDIIYADNMLFQQNEEAIIRGSYNNR